MRAARLSAASTPPEIATGEFVVRLRVRGLVVVEAEIPLPVLGEACRRMHSFSITPVAYVFESRRSAGEFVTALAERCRAGAL